MVRSALRSLCLQVEGLGQPPSSVEALRKSQDGDQNLHCESLDELRRAGHKGSNNGTQHIQEMNSGSKHTARILSDKKESDSHLKQILTLTIYFILYSIKQIFITRCELHCFVSC